MDLYIFCLDFIHVVKKFHAIWKPNGEEQGVFGLSKKVTLFLMLGADR